MLVYCADIGSVKRNCFGWARAAAAPGSTIELGSDPEQLVTRIAGDLSQGLKVSLGFECPLFIPLRLAAAEMSKAREGEGNRPWSAAAGRAVFTEGMIQVPWILWRIAELTGKPVPGFVRWPEFQQSALGLFVWEAFVTGDAKFAGEHEAHAQDAAIAIRAFVEALPNPEMASAVKAACLHSFLGAALLRTGWTADPSVLSVCPIVIRAKASKSAIRAIVDQHGP
jgi:hypothetical protein